MPELSEFAPFSVTIPATSANLGSGFDSFGLALGLSDQVIVHPSADGQVHVDVHGEGAGTVPTDGNNLVARIAANVMHRHGKELPGLRLTAHNNIPHSRGLGSSASAAVAGILIAKQLLAQDGVELTTAEIFQVATEVEGHPDNVAPAIYGGVTLSWITDGVARTTELPLGKPVSVTVGVPNYRASTKQARKAQPVSVPLTDAVFNLSRAGLLVATLATDAAELFEATDDRLHQQYRAPVMPQSAQVVARLREQGHAAAISGAGPSVVVLSADDGDSARAALSAIVDSAWRVETMPVVTKGARIEGLQR